MTNSVKRQTRKVGVAGGFINQMMGNNESIPVVGKGATILSYSDRHAYEVISVNEDSSKCVIRTMTCTFIGESYGDERYTYTSNENGNTMTVEWNEKRKCWGQSWKEIKIIKVLQNKLIKEYSYDWGEYLPVPYKDLIDGEPDGIYTRLKLVKGVTKEYNMFHKLSIIFGVMEQYRDPSF